MSPKHHHMPLSGGDRKALTKELSKSRAMTKIFAARSKITITMKNGVFYHRNCLSYLINNVQRPLALGGFP